MNQFAINAAFVAGALRAHAAAWILREAAQRFPRKLTNGERAFYAIVAPIIFPVLWIAAAAHFTCDLIRAESKRGAARRENNRPRYNAAGRIPAPPPATGTGAPANPPNQGSGAIKRDPTTGLDIYWIRGVEFVTVDALRAAERSQKSEGRDNG